MAKTPNSLRERIAVSPGEAATLLSIDRTTLYAHVMPAVLTGRIQSLMIGRSRRILVSSLLAWVEAQAAQDAA